MKVAWAPLALERLVDAGKYIAAENPVAAESWIERLFERTARLAQFPFSGRVVRERGREDTREILHEGYRVIYRVEASRVLVLTVRHARMMLDASEFE